MKKEQLKQELIELLAKHKLSVKGFIEIVTKINFWADEISKEDLDKAEKNSIEV